MKVSFAGTLPGRGLAVLLKGDILAVVIAGPGRDRPLPSGPRCQPRGLPCRRNRLDARALPVPGLCRAYPELLDPNRGSIGVHHSRFSQAKRDRLDILRRAILTRVRLCLDDLSLQGKSAQRRVRPLGVQVWETVITLTAWCEDRPDFRVFRLDRMSQARLTKDTFRPERGKTLADCLKANPNAA